MNNLKYPPGIPDPANPGNIIRQKPFVLGEKSLKRIKVVVKVVRYYVSIGSPLSALNMHYSNVLKKFKAQWKYLADRKSKDEPTVPKITNTLPVTRWVEKLLPTSLIV